MSRLFIPSSSQPDYMILERIKDNIESAVVTAGLHYNDSKLFGVVKDLAITAPEQHIPCSDHRHQISTSPHQRNITSSPDKIHSSPSLRENTNSSPSPQFPQVTSDTICGSLPAEIRKRRKSADNHQTADLRLYHSENDIAKLFEILDLKDRSGSCVKFTRYSLGSALFNDLNSSSSCETLQEEVQSGHEGGSEHEVMSSLNITDHGDVVRDEETPTNVDDLLFIGSQDGDRGGESSHDSSGGTTITPSHDILPDNDLDDGPVIELNQPERGEMNDRNPSDDRYFLVSDGEGYSSLNNVSSAASQCDLSDEDSSSLEMFDESTHLLVDPDTQSMMIYEGNLQNATLRPEDMSFRSKARMFEYFNVSPTRNNTGNKPLNSTDECIEGEGDHGARSLSPGEIQDPMNEAGCVDNHHVTLSDIPLPSPPDTTSPPPPSTLGYIDSSDDDDPMILPPSLNSDIIRRGTRKRRCLLRSSRRPDHRYPSTVLEEGVFCIVCPGHVESGGMTPTSHIQCEGCEKGAAQVGFGTGPRINIMEQARGSTGFLYGLRGSSLSLADSYYQALSPQPCPQSRGYASSMPFLSADHTTEKRPGRSHSPMSECSRTTNTSRISMAKRAIHNSQYRHHSDEHSVQGSSSHAAQHNTETQLDLPHLLEILTTATNGKLLSSAAGCIQHLAYNQDHMKNRIRDIGCIPILVRLLQAEEEVSLSALGALRNLSFGLQNNLNKIAINEAHGVTLLVQLLKTSDNFEIQELVTGVFWNLSSSEQVKPELLQRALESIVKYIVIPQSGWKGSQVRSDLANNIQCTTVFRNATGCLRNLSSAGLEGRQVMRSCYGLVDSLLFVLRCVQGKNDVDNKAVENSVGILRNLSYRLDSEVSPEHKYGQTDDWRSKGLGGGQFKRKEMGDDIVKRKKNSKKHKGKENATPLPEHTNGVGLLWQPNVVRVYLDLLLECSNPETLEGAAATLQNLTASSWEPAQLLRESVRKEKGLSVITSLLRMTNDSVVRATAVCLRNLAGDAKNKELLGENALPDLVKRLPGGDGADGITDMTIGAIISALLELVSGCPETAKRLKDLGGIGRLVEISRSTDVYSAQCVHISNRLLASCWEIRELRKCIKNEGWNIAMLQRHVAPDRSDGLEYDETNNQFKASYNTGLDRTSRNRHRSPGRALSPGAMSPGSMSPGARRVLSPSGYEANIHGRGGDHPTMGRAASTMGRSYNDPTFTRAEEYDMGRGQSLPTRSLAPPSSHHNPLSSHNYGAADSWV